MNINPHKFKELLIKKRVSQKELENKIGVPNTRISVWLNRKSIPTKNIDSINKALDIDLEEYFSSDIPVVDHLSSGKPPIPYYGDIDIIAGKDEFWNTSVVSEPTAYYSLPDTDAELVLPVFGNSMSTRIESGDKIAVKQIKDLSFFNYGMEYVIITEDYRLVKQIRKHKNPKLVILHSHNSEEFDDIDLPISKIIHLFSVVEILKKNQ